MPTTPPSSSAPTRARRGSSRSTRHRHGSAACLAAAWAWRPGSSSRSSPLPLSAAACSPGRRAGARVPAPAPAAATLGAVAGHAAAEMSRHDLKELGEHLDEGSAGLVVVAVSDMGAKVERAMERARKLEQKQLQADVDEIEADVAGLERATAGP